MRWLSLVISVVFAFLTTLGQAGWTTMAEHLGIGALLWIWMIASQWRKEPVWMETPDGIKEY